jgi:hypothetical protein
MPTIEYPFLSRSPDEPAKPLLPVHIVNPITGKSLDTFGLIDTGADCCVIPGFMTRILGHNLSAGVKINGMGAGGKTKGYFHSTEILIYGLTSNGDPDSSIIIHHMPNSIICCMENLPLVLLGVPQFLERFKLTIDYPNQKFSLI